MDQSTNSFGNFPGFSEADQKSMQQALELGAPNSAANGLRPTLETTASVQQSRARRLENEANQLQAALGADHPLVLQAQQLAQSGARISATLDTQLKRTKNAPKLSPNEWSVFGRVLGLDGQPAAGLTVRVSDRDRKLDDLLGETNTDEFGDFHVIYHERDFKETRENLPELYVTVEDASGALLFTSRDNVRYNSGRMEYFLIQLGEQGTPPRKPATRK